MLNLSFVFDDAARAVTRHAKHLAVVPLPAAVYMMQVDVINHYRHALEHYLTLTLNEPYLQKSSFGTPYQKWAHYTNDDFGTLSFAIHNLLRYTSRMVHETECIFLRESERYAEMKKLSNHYTDPICEHRFRHKSIGVTIHEDYRLSINAVRIGFSLKGFSVRGGHGEPLRYSRMVRDANGNESEQLITREEYQELTGSIQTETIDIGDRTKLATIQERGLREIAELKSRNDAFATTCNDFYRKRKVAEPFTELNESYWI